MSLDRFSNIDEKNCLKRLKEIIIKEGVKLTKKMKKVKILLASTREPYNYLQAKSHGCSIITMPPNVINKISKFGKSLQDLSLDTVKKFLKDSKNSKFRI